ncbi:MAG: hypothetical protein F4X30_02655 [Acidimicrobiaceae bacterium]|nr:hypothetical protein [Acidimicrobiaceae bacterium]
MASRDSSTRARSQVRVACGRIEAAAAAIIEAHRLGIPEGPHASPWEPDCCRAAVGIYAESLPPWYQREMAALFSQAARALGEMSIPARLAEDWVIITTYLVSARVEILRLLASEESAAPTRPPASLESAAEQANPPMVIRFDELAQLTTSEGATRLLKAAVAVREQMEAAVPEGLDERELKLLKQLAGGVPVADLAAQAGYSERSIYRAMSGLWQKLGVQGRKEGVEKAALEGLLD